MFYFTKEIVRLVLTMALNLGWICPMGLYRFLFLPLLIAYICGLSENTAATHGHLTIISLECPTPTSILKCWRTS